jgi:hypothetical protein
MKQLGAAVLLAVAGLAVAQQPIKKVLCTPTGNGSVHDFSHNLLDGSGPVNFRDHAGKILIMVNVASF